MPTNDKDLLKEKLKIFFENRINNLNNKFQNDINSIEFLKFNYYDYCIKPLKTFSEINDNINTNYIYKN